MRQIQHYLLRGQPTFGCHFCDTGFGDQPCLGKAKPSQSRVGWKVGSAHPPPAAQVGKLVGIFQFLKSRLYYLWKSRVDMMGLFYHPETSDQNQARNEWPSLYHIKHANLDPCLKCIFAVKWFLRIWIIFLLKIFLNFHIRANASPSPARF